MTVRHYLIYAIRRFCLAQQVGFVQRSLRRDCFIRGWTRLYRNGSPERLLLPVRHPLERPISKIMFRYKCNSQFSPTFLDSLSLSLVYLINNSTWIQMKAFPSSDDIKIVNEKRSGGSLASLSRAISHLRPQRLASFSEKFCLNIQLC